MTAVSICSDFGAQEKRVMVSTVPHLSAMKRWDHYHEVMGLSWHISIAIYISWYIYVLWYTRTHTHTHVLFLWITLNNTHADDFFSGYFGKWRQTPHWHHGPALKKSVLLASQNVYLFILWGKNVKEVYCLLIEFSSLIPLDQFWT